MERESSEPGLLAESPAAGIDGKVGNEGVGRPGYDDIEQEEQEDEACDLPPGRIHATRSTSEIRLRGSGSRQYHHHHHHASLPNLSGSGGGGGGGSSGMTTPSDGSVSSIGSAGSGGGKPSANNNDAASSSSSQQQQQRRSASTGNLYLHHHSPRSKSPSFQLRSGTGGSTAATAAPTMDGNSSISSLEDFVDSDILYDRAGLIQDLDVLSSSTTGSLDGSKSGGGGGGGSSAAWKAAGSSLPSVNERLSDETLEDVHAFSDVKVIFSSSSNASRANSLTDAGDEKAVLDPLEEGDEEDDDDQDSLEDPSESSSLPPVILTNIENLDLHAQQNVVATANSADEHNTANNMDLQQQHDRQQPSEDGNSETAVACCPPSQHPNI